MAATKIVSANQESNRHTKSSTETQGADWAKRKLSIRGLSNKYEAFSVGALDLASALDLVAA